MAKGVEKRAVKNETDTEARNSGGEPTTFPGYKELIFIETVIFSRLPRLSETTADRQCDDMARWTVTKEK